MTAVEAISANWERVLPVILGISVVYARLEALVLWLARRAGVLRMVARVLRRIANTLDDTAKAAQDGQVTAAEVAQVVNDLTTDKPEATP